MKIVLISDTHTARPELPEGDILIHAGDWTMDGHLIELKGQMKWIETLRERYTAVIGIAGNHDFCLEDHRVDQARMMLEDAGVTYLQDQSLFLGGLNFYGSPWQPWFGGWAFNAMRGADIKQYWDKIPQNTDVLITHGPPKGVLDKTPAHYGNQNVGCEELAFAVDRIRPKLHVFGHIHNGYGMEVDKGVQFVNASIMNESYKPVNVPIAVEVFTNIIEGEPQNPCQS